jgi:hypothetical protein
VINKSTISVSPPYLSLTYLASMNGQGRIQSIFCFSLSFHGVFCCLGQRLEAIPKRFLLCLKRRYL